MEQASLRREIDLYPVVPKKPSPSPERNMSAPVGKILHEA